MTVAIKENRRADAWEAVGGKESRVRAGFRYMYIYIYLYILLVLARIFSFFLGSSWLDVAIYEESFARPVK